MFSEDALPQKILPDGAADSIGGNTPPPTPTKFNQNQYESFTQDSPSFFPSTQDGNEATLDVVWDWNSPHTRLNKLSNDSNSVDKRKVIHGKKLFHSPLKLEPNPRNKYLKTERLNFIHSAKEQLELLNKQLLSKPPQSLVDINNCSEDSFQDVVLKCEDEIETMCTQMLAKENRTNVPLQKLERQDSDDIFNGDISMVEPKIEDTSPIEDDYQLSIADTQLPGLTNGAIKREVLENCDTNDDSLFTNIANINESNLFLKPCITTNPTVSNYSIKPPVNKAGSPILIKSVTAINSHASYSMSNVNSGLNKKFEDIQAVKQCSSPNSLKKYKSFNDLNASQSRCTPEEIERKRREALAKRVVKKPISDHINQSQAVRVSPPSKPLEVNLPKVNDLKISNNIISSTSPSRMQRKYKSFQDATSNSNFKCTPEEIERKRREALAKREKKVYVDVPNLNTSSESHRNFEKRNHSFDGDSSSNIVLSQELVSDIEKKRKEAMEKLEIKRKQEEIQRKKREALARLEKKKKVV